MIDFNMLQVTRVAGVDGGEYAGACPFCGGRDRFRAWPNAEYPHYWCRQCGARGALGEGENAVSTRFHRKETRHEPSPTPQPGWPALTDPGWQAAADRFITHCWVALHDYHPEVLEWLRNERGLTDSAIDAAELGYNPADREDTWGGVKVWLPRGLVIPWEFQHTYWRVRIRVGPSEYRQPKGCANGLYLADYVYPGCTVILTESELDALVIYSHCGELRVNGLVPVATGGTNNAHLMRWTATLAKAQRVLVAFDADDPGEKAADWWLGMLGDKAVRLRPTRHDVTDMWRLGENLAVWISSALAR